MSSVYTVIVRNERDIETIEVYAGVQSALGRAFHLANLHEKNLKRINISPDEEKLEDGSIRWVFLNTYEVFVGVFFKRIESSLLSKRDRLSSVVGIDTPAITFTLPQTVPSLADVKASDVPRGFDPEDVVIGLPAYDIMDRSMPAGFDLNNKPILMGTLLDDPYSVKGPENLTTHQKWALVIARARKNPDWRTLPKGYSGYAPHAASALPELEAKSPFGELIMEGEIDTLQAIYDDALLKDNVDRDLPGYLF